MNTTNFFAGRGGAAYSSPQLTFIELSVERGFAATGGEPATDWNYDDLEGENDLGNF